MSGLFFSDELSTKNGVGRHTAVEITRQPETWIKVWEKIKAEQETITSFLNEVASFKDLNIVLTGAGSSAFIGDTASSSWLKSFSCSTQAIPTTDLVTHFDDNITSNQPLLLISFARSGNSPESTEAIRLANEACDRVFHFIITCNSDGKLAQMKDRDNSYVFLLPPEAEDQSLAMTNSFTSMTLSAILIPSLISGSDRDMDKQVELLSAYGKKIVQQHAQTLYTIADLDFNKVVFLGSGANWGIAKESHLKVQELTNGKVVGKFDSFLGFRHGPKAIIDDDTLIVYLLSNQDEVQQYEKDLINQINGHSIGLTTLCIAENKPESIETDYAVSLADQDQLDDRLWPIACTLPGQIIGFYKSLTFNYDPDNPSPDGTISRVVEGVTIYD